MFLKYACDFSTLPRRTHTHTHTPYSCDKLRMVMFHCPFYILPDLTYKYLRIFAHLFMVNIGLKFSTMSLVLLWYNASFYFLKESGLQLVYFFIKYLLQFTNKAIWPQSFLCGNILK